MPYIVKTSPFVGGLGDCITVEHRALYGGSHIAAGDEVFIWLSETQGGSGLCWRGSVSRAAPAHDGSITLDIRLTAQAPEGALRGAELEPWRDGPGDSPLASLSRKLYRHAHNKIAALDNDEAAILMQRF